jgi:uncharacterized alkaline shock family protein YloU
MLAHRPQPATRRTSRVPADAPHRPVAGRALVTRRALEEIVRAAVLGSYGVTGLTAPLRSRLGLGRRALRVALRPEIVVDVHLTIAHGLPVAEVARQVDSAIRYGLRRAIGRDIGRVTIHVDGLDGRPFSTPGAGPNRPVGESAP